jgi:hypothetical protein
VQGLDGFVLAGQAAAAPGLAWPGAVGQVDGVGPGAVIGRAVELGAAGPVLLVGGVTASAAPVNAASLGGLKGHGGSSSVNDRGFEQPPAICRVHGEAGGGGVWRQGGNQSRGRRGCRCAVEQGEGPLGCVKGRALVVPSRRQRSDTVPHFPVSVGPPSALPRTAAWRLTEPQRRAVRVIGRCPKPRGGRDARVRHRGPLGRGGRRPMRAGGCGRARRLGPRCMLVVGR